MKAKDWYVFILVWIFLFQFVLEVTVPWWPQLWPWFLIVGGLSIWLIGDQYPTFFQVLTAFLVVLIHLVRKTFRRDPMFNTSMAMFAIAIAFLCASPFFNGKDAVMAAVIGVGFVGVGGILLLFYLWNIRQHRPTPPWGVVRSRFAREDSDRDS